MFWADGEGRNAFTQPVIGFFKNYFSHQNVEMLWMGINWKWQRIADNVIIREYRRKHAYPLISDMEHESYFPIKWTFVQIRTFITWLHIFSYFPFNFQFVYLFIIIGNDGTIVAWPLLYIKCMKMGKLKWMIPYTIQFWSLFEAHIKNNVMCIMYTM